MYGGRQLEFQKLRPARRKKVSHYQNARLDTGFSQGDTLVDVAYGEPSGTGCFQRPGNLQSSMAVSICFHDRHYRYIRPGRPADGAKVLGNLV